MREQVERPVCHRAEDLVTYLYGESTSSEKLDFQEHLRQCDACRSEFGVFNQVHDSIVVWRDEALGSSFAPAAWAKEEKIVAPQFLRPERKMSGWAALRQFFQVSPLWLRGATAFAGLLLCVLAALTISRTWQRPPAIATPQGEVKVYTESDFRTAVAQGVKAKTQELQNGSAPEPKEIRAPEKIRRSEVATVHKSVKPRVKALSREESEQLAADLRLIPGEDDEQLFGIVDQPNR